MEGLLSDFNEVYGLELILLCLILAVGCYTSYTDIHVREISNGSTWGLLGLGLAGQVGFWALGQTDLGQMGVRLAAGLGVSYLLFVYGFWAPGDAKLFWAVLVALPPTLFRPVPFFSSQTPLWALLLNALLVNFVILLFLPTVQRFRHGPAPGKKQGIVWQEVGYAAVELVGLTGLIIGGSALFLRRPLTFVEAAVAVVVLSLLIDRFVPRDYRVVLGVPGLALGGYSLWQGQLWSIYLALWAFAWGVHTLYEIIGQRYQHAFRQVLPMGALSEGMVPCLAICGVSVSGRPLRYVCAEQVDDAVEEVVCYPGRPLSAGKVRQLREMAARGEFRRFGDRLTVETNLPFAPAIVVAVILTALIGGSLTRPMEVLGYSVQQWLGG